MPSDDGMTRETDELAEATHLHLRRGRRSGQGLNRPRLSVPTAAKPEPGVVAEAWAAQASWRQVGPARWLSIRVIVRRD